MLYAPRNYHEATKEDLKGICNGCGARGSVNVPDKLLGLSITEACNIHDFMFRFGTTQGDFLFANAIFLLNMTSLILDKSRWYSKLPRLGLAVHYFAAVALYGNKFFWGSKTKNTRKNITFRGEFR